MAAGLSALGALIAGGCSSPSQSVPQVPEGLYRVDELPIGSEGEQRLSIAGLSVAKRLEPEWGKLHAAFFMVSAPDRAGLPEAVRRAVPEDWTLLDLNGFQPQNGRMFAYRKDRSLFAVVALDPVKPGAGPVLVLRNQALVETLRGRLE